MERETQIRAHHLTMWSDIVHEYLKCFQGKKPWEIPFEKFSEIALFVDGFAKNQTGKDLEIVMEFEKYDIDNDDAWHEYAYRIDMIGTDDESYRKVLGSRIKHFMEIVTAVSKDKNTMFLLSSQPDGYCKACATGNHCRETGPDFASNDLRHLKVLGVLGVMYREKGMLRITGDGVYISGELLFDEEFHKLVQEGVKRERERSWV